MKTIVVVMAFIAVVAAQEMQATVEIKPHKATSNVTGFLKLSQDGPNGSVTITGKINGLTPGMHGFHVHEKGNITDGCTSTGPHFNPTNKFHGGPTDAERHVGDLGNIEANAMGIAEVLIIDHIVSLSGENDIRGRAIVVHSDKDDYGRGDKPLSKVNGQAGLPVACGIISDSTKAGSSSSGNRVSIQSPLFLSMSILSILVVRRSKSL